MTVKRELRFRSTPTTGWVPCEIGGLRLCPSDVASELGYKLLPDRVIAIQASRDQGKKQRGMWVTIRDFETEDSYYLVDDDGEYVKVVGQKQFDALEIEPRIGDRWWVTARLISEPENT